MPSNRRFETGMVAALYTRVSTDMQVQADSLATQEKVLRDYCRFYELKVHDHYCDAGFSGSHTENRPEYLRMLADAKEKKFGVVIVTKLDRISRNLVDLLGLLNTLERLGVAFVSSSQNFDTSTSMGRLTLNILGSFAQFEREMIADRVRESMLVRAKDGKWNGGIVPYGYREEGGKLLLREDEGPWVKRIFELYLEHRSIRHITHCLNAQGSKPRYSKSWSTNSVRRILLNPSYYGATTYNKRKGTSTTSIPRPEKEWIVVDGVLPEIVTKDEWQQAQKILRHESGLHPRNKLSDYLLSGLIKCGRCGGVMNGYNHHKMMPGGGSRYSYYRCGWRQSKGPSVCQGLTVDRFLVERAVVDALARWAHDPTLVIERARELIASKEYIQGRIDDQAQSLRTRIAEIDKSLERLFDAYQEGLLDKEEAAGRARPLKSEKQILQDEIGRLGCESGISGVQGEVDAETLRQAFAQFGEVFEALHIQERKELLAGVVKKVVAMPEGRLDVHLHVGVLKLALGLKDEALARAGDGDLVIVLNTSKEIHMTSEFSEMRSFGERVQWLRTKNRLTKKDLARSLCMNECSVANWEIRGRVPRVHEVQQKVADFFGIAVDTLIG